MPLGTEVGLGPGDIVSDGDLDPPSERDTIPLYAVTTIFLLPVWV